MEFVEIVGVDFNIQRGGPRNVATKIRMGFLEKSPIVERLKRFFLLVLRERRKSTLRLLHLKVE